jgi:hypothetical protein
MAETLPSRILHHPDADAIGDAYRALPQPGIVRASCVPAALAATLAALERAGFVAIELNRATLGEADLDLRAYKAKAGPCYETGRRVRYCGAALAALDDDDHLIFADMRVCEKTAGVYGLPPYAGRLTVSPADPALLARLADAPVPFDCNTYERDLAILRERLAPAPPPDAPRRAVLYPGPCRALILADGSVLRRGQATLLTVDAAATVIAGDGAVAVDGLPGFTAVPAVDLRTALATEGSACLLGELTLADTWSPVERPLDLAALDHLPSALRDRLQAMIDRGDRQVVLTGTNPTDKFGCCPSDEVGAAQRLVQAGILAAWQKPAPPGSCPVTIFAVAGEITVIDGRPVFTIDAGRRAMIAARLRNPAGPGPARDLIRWLLLIFVIAALVAGTVKLLRSPHRGPPIGEVLGVAAGETVDVLVLFHQSRRCDLCRALEAGARAALRGEVASQVDAGRLRLELIATDAPGREHLQYTAAGFTTGLVLFRFTAGAASGEFRLDATLTHAHDPDALRRSIEDALTGAPGRD